MQGCVNDRVDDVYQKCASASIMHQTGASQVLINKHGGGMVEVCQQTLNITKD